MKYIDYPNECKGVGWEIGAHSKRKTTPLLWNEDIVSAHGDMGITRVEQLTVGILMAWVKQKMVEVIFVL